MKEDPFNLNTAIFVFPFPVISLTAFTKCLIQLYALAQSLNFANFLV